MTDTTTDLTVRILQDIRDGVRETNVCLGNLESRFDNLLKFAGDRYRDHEERINACERSIEELRDSR